MWLFSPSISFILIRSRIFFLRISSVAGLAPVPERTYRPVSALGARRLGSADGDPAASPAADTAPAGEGRMPRGIAGLRGDGLPMGLPRKMGPLTDLRGLNVAVKSNGGGSPCKMK